MTKEEYAQSPDRKEQGPRKGMSRYQSIKWRDLEEVIIKACGATSQGLTDPQRRGLTEGKVYTTSAHEVKRTKPLVDLYDESEDFRKYVAWRVKYQKELRNGRPSRSLMLSDIGHVDRPNTGWIAWRAKNGTEPQEVEVVYGTYSDPLRNFDV